MHDSLEPQASTKALEERQRGASLQGDVGSRMNADFTDPDAIRMAAAHAAKLACNAAARDASLPSARSAPISLGTCFVTNPPAATLDLC